MVTGDLTTFKIEDLPLWKEGESDKPGIRGGQYKRSPFVAFDENSEPLVLKPEAADVVEVSTESRFHRVSQTQRSAGDEMLRGGIGLLSTLEDGRWGPSVTSLRGMQKYLYENALGLWLHEGSKPGSQQLARVFERALESEQFPKAVECFLMYAGKRRKQGVHSETPFGAKRKQDDPEEGFPFLAATFIGIVRGLASSLVGNNGKAGEALESEEGPGAGTAGEVGAGEGMEKELEAGEQADLFKRALLRELYAMGAWVFREVVQELHQVAVALNVLEDPRTAKVLDFYSACGTAASPNPDQIDRGMWEWASATHLRESRNADGGHPFMMPPNSLDTVRERVDEFGIECLHLPKIYEGFTHLASHSWLKLLESVAMYEIEDEEVPEATVSAAEMEQIIQNMMSPHTQPRPAKTPRQLNKEAKKEAAQAAKVAQKKERKEKKERERQDAPSSSQPTSKGDSGPGS